MAMLQLFCKNCNHTFYRVQTACINVIEQDCPICNKKRTQQIVLQPKNGEPLIAPCKHG